MDVVELARQEAASLHRSALEKGFDPTKPYEFVRKIASELRDLDVEDASPGASILNGSRATLSPKDHLVIHERCATEFEQAFLVAHELGHELLGDSPTEADGATFDPMRPAEASPVGEERVVDYGRRQRREVQMDLFARELLLPREVMRRLHVHEEQSASEIATRFKAPFEVVAQQLLDALLLPVVPKPQSDEEEPRTPNELQQSAADHRGPAFLLEAGPGTGKTQTLVTRVEGLLRENVDPRRILLLTFSNKAAGEMVARIARKHKEAAAAMWIGTFHAFGLDLVRRFHTELGLSKDPRMMDRTEAVELLEERFTRLDLEHYRDFYDPTQNIADILGAISRAKDEVVSVERYEELAAAMKAKTQSPEQVLRAEQVEEVARVYRAYEMLKRDRNRIDFGDLVMMPVQLLTTNAQVRTLLQESYDHVLVDEYQDVNRSSVHLLQALRSTGTNLWAVGDVKQSIYRFRGASSFNLGRFGKQDFAGGERARLKCNYRSVPEIVDAYSAFAREMKVGDPDSGLKAARKPQQHPPELRVVQRADQQSVALADAIEEMRAVGHAYRNQVVLCTGNDRLVAIGRELERQGIPVLFLGSLFERPEVKDLFAFLTLLSDRRAMGLVRLARLPQFGMAIEDVSRVFEFLREGEYEPTKWLREAAVIGNVSEQGKAALEALAAATAGMDQASRPWSALVTLLLERTRMAADLSQATTVDDRARGVAIWQFLNFVRSQPGGSGLPIARLLERVRRLVRLGDDSDLRQLPTAAQGIDAVRLMTVHGAKGLEFSVVHFPGMNADTLPGRMSKPECLPPDGMVEGAVADAWEAFQAGREEEQECIFFVALSRARDRLFLYAVSKIATGARRPLSPFLDRLGPHLSRNEIVPTRELPKDPEGTNVPIEIDGQLELQWSHIGQYERCARRYFYTHLLRTGGRRTETPFMQMHEAVRAVVRDVVAGTTPVTEAGLIARLHQAFAEQGLNESGYVADYSAFSQTLLNYFASSREGHASEPPVPIRFSLGGAEISVLPDEVLLGADGVRRFRRIATGVQTSKDTENAGAMAFALAVRSLDPAARAEFVYLTDAEIVPIALGDRKVISQSEKMGKLIEAIQAGSFPAKRSSRSCPTCPAFFVCGDVPTGTLKKKF